MNAENEMNEEVRQLLDSLEEHGKNARRQQRLGDLIDSLEASGTKRRRLIPLWWAVGAAAACLLIWLLVKPNMKQTTEMEEQNLVEKVESKVSIKAEENNIVIEEPMAKEELLAEGTPTVPQIPQMKKEKPQTESVEEVIEQSVLAEVTPTKPEATTNTESINLPIRIEEKPSTPNSQLSTQNSPQRRVIRSLNLVCYECQKEPDNNSQLSTLNSQLEKTIFGQPQDPNMKNGSLAFELKLH